MTHLHMESFGQNNGPDLVLLHGWAMHIGIWHEVCVPLSRYFRLHLIDLPGHGDSTIDQLGTLQHWVDSIGGLLPQRCFVVGWSLGGQIAIELALQYPQQVQKLILVATTPCFVKLDGWEFGAEPKLLELFWENLKQNYKATIQRFLTLQMIGDRYAIQNVQKIRKHFFERKQPNAMGLEQGLKILQTSDLRSHIPAIQQPVLLLHGDNDVITHSQAAYWMQQQIARSRLVTFTHCGHAPFLSDPEQFVACLSGF